MKHLKLFGLLVVAAASMMAFAASASATTVTDSAGGTTPTIHAVSEEDAVPGTNHVLLHNESANIECNSTVEGKVEKHGAGVTASGLISSLIFNNCTGGWVVTVNTKGSLEVHTTSTANHGTATLTSSGATVTAVLFGGFVTCRYRTENTHIGTVTGGNPATLKISAKIPFHGGSGLCGGETANWTGSYKTTGTLKFDA